MSSTLIREGGDEVECISVEVEVGQQRLVVVSGYGPQVIAAPAKKQLFWDYLEKEVQEAAREEKLLIIQMDSNAWLGRNTIPGDPNKVPNSNGKLFHCFLQRNKNITLVNAMSICEGIISRQRKTDLLNKKSAIDVFLVCERVLPFVKRMIIDENQESPLTNFHGLNKNGKITESDHNKMELILNIEAPISRPKREEMFNFKDIIGQTTFCEITNNSSKLRNTFKSEEDFLEKAAKFKKNS